MGHLQKYLILKYSLSEFGLNPDHWSLDFDLTSSNISYLRNIEDSSLILKGTFRKIKKKQGWTVLWDNLIYSSKEEIIEK